MELNKLLEQQVKMLPAYSGTAEFQAFLSRVNETYNRLEKKDLVFTQEDENPVAQNLTSNAGVIKEPCEIDYKGIVEKSTEFIYKANKFGYFTYVNPASERITGYSKDELLNMHFAEFIKDDNRKEAINFYRRQVVEKNKATYYEFPITTKSGEEKWISQTVQLSDLEGEGFEYIVRANDITVQKIYERSIFLQNEKYKNIISNMKLGLLEVDTEGHILYANPGFAAISGYEARELNGKKVSELFVTDTHIDIVKSKPMLRSEGISDMYEVQVKNKNGDLRWWMISGAPDYDELGNVTGSIEVHLDITEKKKLESELELERKKAEDSSRAKAAFLANMSHEIRTPLNGIIGMVRELSFEQLSERQSKFVNNASVASQHLLSVLNNVLDISKIEAGELSLEKHHFKLKNTVKEVKIIMVNKAREKGLFFGLDVHDINNVIYLGDSSRIRQILLNLIGNAIKFTNTGGVYVECKIKSVKENVHTVSITVEDSGIGMEDTYQENLYDKFSQEDSSTSRKYGGSGLGMAITREIIQLMHGTISVKSKKNEGTTIEVVFDLPVGEIEQLDINDKPKQSKDLSNVRILLVEDNDFNRAVASNTLIRNNCKVTEAENGKEAIALLLKEKFDLILMDLQMPVMDGFETTKNIRKSLKITTPIIALTANAFKSELEKCIKIGMNDYVTKPYEEDKLVGVILKCLYDVPMQVKAIKPPSKAKVKAGNDRLYDLGKLLQVGQNNRIYVRKMLNIFTN